MALPSALLGGAGHDDPHIRSLHERLATCNRRIVNNELNLPPEGERSPSPTPIYDRNGVRLNTREVRPVEMAGLLLELPECHHEGLSMHLALV